MVGQVATEFFAKEKGEDLEKVSLWMFTEAVVIKGACYGKL